MCEVIEITCVCNKVKEDCYRVKMCKIEVTCAVQPNLCLQMSLFFVLTICVFGLKSNITASHCKK